jgi:hypothetical protein
MVPSLTLAVTFAFIAAFHLEPRDWETPMQFSGDALVAEAGVMHCAEAGPRCLVSSVIPRLGAPGVADWADFPRTEKAWWLVGGLLARWLGLGWAVNLLFLGAAIGAALTFYLAARRLLAHPAIAAATALLFALSPYLFTRNQQHLALTLYLAVPIAILVWRRLAQARAPDGMERFFLLLASAFLGTQTVYYAAYFVIGLVLVGALQVRWRRPALAWWCGLSVAVTLMVLALGSLDTLWLVAREGFNRQAVLRGTNDATNFGLWPEQLFIPSDFHRWPLVRAAVSSYSTRFGLRGEYGSAYLGLVGAVALLALLFTFGRRLLLRGAWRAQPWRSPTGRTAGLVLFWLALAMPWGVLAMVGRSTGFAVLRSNNRVSIVLLAVALLWLGHRLSRWSARRGSAAPWLVAGVVASLGLGEQVPLTEPDVDLTYRERTARTYASAGALVRRLEGTSQAPRIFVYPAQSFPEDPRPPFGDPYLPLELFVTSERAELSFGGVRGRPAGDWPVEAARMPEDALAQALRTRGFSGLVTHRAACDAQTCLPRLRGVLSQLPGVEAVEVSGSDWLAWTFNLSPDAGP